MMRFDVYLNRAHRGTRESSSPMIVAAELADMVAEKRGRIYLRMRVSGSYAILDLLHYPDGDLKRDQIVACPYGAMASTAAAIPDRPQVRGAVSAGAGVRL